MNFFLYFLGLETLLGLVCFCLFLYQTIVLLRNFNSRDTLKITKEMDYEGPMPSPLVIFCQDPGSLNISEDNVRLAPYTWSNFTIEKITTAFKVIKVNINMTVFQNLNQRIEKGTTELTKWYWKRLTF